MPEWIPNPDPTTTNGAAQLTPEAEAAAERALRVMLEESYADLESMYREDIGWQRIGQEASQFTASGREQMAAIGDLHATGNALIKRGVNLRIAYVWGQGVTIGVRDDGAVGQDVNAVWQDFWDEPSNRRAFTASEAQARYERKLATNGEIFWAFPTDRLTGRVRIRRIDPAEVVDRVCNPEDAAEVWLYKRQWNAVTVDPATGRRDTEKRTTFYPALGYTPPVRPRTWGGVEIRWDAPMRHVAVNVPDKDWRGLGDVLAALPWARMDKEFLEDLSVYMRALTRILGHVTAKPGRAAAAARRAVAGTTTDGVTTDAGPGGWAVTDPGTTLNLVSKSGAQINAESHRPFATMTASALEVPLTMLLGDPGITGARATAETLDQPTELTFRLRREVHTELFRDIADYVIDQAVLAPRGPLRGTIVRDGNRVIAVLPEEDERTVEVSWPEYSSTPIEVLVAAIVAAEGTDILPPVEVLKLLGRAFGLEDIDALVDQMTDDDGNFIPPAATSGQVAVDRLRNGEDPAAVL